MELQSYQMYSTRYQSFGLGICKYENGEPYILLCRHKLSYEFLELVNGKYSASNITKVKTLIADMTSEEQRLIFTRNFDKLWLYAENNEFSRYKEACKKKFNEIINLISQPNNSKQLIWDLPKGWQNKSELNLDTAIRETQEEINLTPRNYKIIFDKPPVVTTYIDYNVLYKMVFYIAEYSSSCDELWYINSGEIDRVEWWSRERVINEFTGPLYESVITILANYADYVQKNIYVLDSISTDGCNSTSDS